MRIDELEGIIEAILFSNGESVSAEKIAEVTEVDLDTVEKVIENMESKYKSDVSRGIHIIRLENNYQICTKPDAYRYIKILNEKKSKPVLSNAGLEVLSIVAYNQPVTRGTIEFIRGVNSDGALARLVELELVEERGRLDAPGKPMLFGTTEEFLRCFGISSLDALPEIEMDLASLTEEIDVDQMRFETDPNKIKPDTDETLIETLETIE